MKTGRDPRITVLTESSSEISSVARMVRDHVDPAAHVTVVTDPLKLAGRETQVDDLDLLHVPAHGELPLPRAGLLAERSGLARIGVISDEAGLVLTSASRAAFACFVRGRDDQADAGVYATGAEIRAGASHASSLPLPRQLYLGLTQRCNRSCVFCVSRTFAVDALEVHEIRDLAQEDPDGRFSAQGTVC